MWAKKCTLYMVKYNKSRLDEAEDQKSKLEDKIAKNTQSEQ